MAATSSMVSCAVAVAPRTGPKPPPEVTINRLDPILAIRSVIPELAPWLKDTMVMTAPTPMITPSIVRNERILLSKRLRQAICRHDIKSMFLPPYSLLGRYGSKLVFDRFGINHHTIAEAYDTLAVLSDLVFMSNYYYSKLLFTVQVLQ